MHLTKPIRFIFLVFVASLLVLGFMYFEFRKPESEQTIIPSELQNGDLIFRKGRSIESFTVYLADEEKAFSHVGMVYLLNGKPQIIHAVPGESGNRPEWIKMENPEHFLAPEKASAFAIYRSKYSSGELSEVAYQAFLFYKKKYLFDNNYSLETDDKLYCTELVLKAFRNAGLPLSGIEQSRLHFLLGEHDLVMPGTLIRNPSFSKVTYN